MTRAPAGALCLVLWFSGALGPALAQQADAVAPAADTPRRSYWIVTPSLKLAETYSDNVFLSPDGLQRSDWITQIIPGISVIANGPRLRLDASYAPELLYHAQTNREEKLFHRGNAIGTLELADKLLFLEAGATVDQFDISLQGPLTAGNTNITGNRATATTTHVSPYVKRDIGSAARAEARFTYSTWQSDQNQQALPDNTGRRVFLRLANTPAYKVLTWDVAYTGETIDYQSHHETTTDVLNADARRSITSTVGVLVRAGYERYDTGLPDALEDPRYSAGFDWTPTRRTRLAATAGQRLGDETYSFEFRHRTRLTSWNLTYDEDVTTSREQFFLPGTQTTAGALDPMFLSQYPDPVARQKAVQEFIARMGLPPSLGSPLNFFSEQLFLQKRWLASVGLQGVRNTLVATAFWQLRRELTGRTVSPVDDFIVSPSIRTSGGSLAWALRLTARNTWNLQAGYTRSEFLDSGQRDNFVHLQAGLTRQFQPRVSGSLYYRLQARESTQGTAAEYLENAGIASLLMTF